MKPGKGIGALILATKPDKGEDDEEGPDTEREDGEKADAEELAREAFSEAFDALKKGDREAFIEALLTGCMHAADC